MHFLTDRWRRIGARLYLALGFAVFLTLVSSGVGVYYFERSGDLNFRVQSESAPVLEAAWSAGRDIERLRSLGIAAGADPVSIERVSIEQDGKSPASESTGDQSVESILARLDASLAVVNSAPELASDAMKLPRSVRCPCGGRRQSQVEPPAKVGGRRPGGGVAVPPGRMVS